MKGQNPEHVRCSHFRTLWYLFCVWIFWKNVRNFKKFLDHNESREHLSSEVTRVFDFFHCPIFVKHAISDVDLLQSIGWTRCGYISFLFYLMMEAEPAIKALCVCLTKTRQWKKTTFTCSNLMNATSRTLRFTLVVGTPLMCCVIH